MELLLLPFLTSPPSFAPSLPCQISALHFQGSQEQGWRHLWSPCSSLLIDLCHYPSNPPARSSCLQHCSPLSQELWIYPAKAQGNNCLFAAQAFEIPGENEISLACFRSWGSPPALLGLFPNSHCSCSAAKHKQGAASGIPLGKGQGAWHCPLPVLRGIHTQLLIQLSLFLSRTHRAKPSWGNLTFQLQRN